MDDEIRIIWHGHSCFTVETPDGTAVFDPYQEGSVPGYPPLRLTADQVLCSHDHADHNAAACVRLTGRTPSYRIQEIHTFHDPEGGTLRGPDTIRILSSAGYRVAHLGDLGCGLTEEQKEPLRRLDAILIPVGGHFTIDAKQAHDLVAELEPRVVIPMHFRFGDSGYGVIGTLDEFTKLCSDLVAYPGNTLVLNRDTPKQTALLTFQG